MGVDARVIGRLRVRNDLLATVNSFTLSKTSIASFSVANDRYIVSNVLVCIVSGHRP